MRLRVCIVSHDAYGALTGGHTGRTGGVEWQTSLTARWLARRGYDVSLLTWDEGQRQACVVDGIHVLPICDEKAGLPGLRFFHPRWTSLNRALARADADVYYHNCGEAITGQVALWCRLHGRGFVYSVASDPDCDARLPHMRSLRERMLYRYGLRHADRVLVQTLRQQRMLREGFGAESTVVRMPCPGPGPDEYIEPTPASDGATRVAWVGRIVEVKRLEVLLEIAAAMPEVTFEVAGSFEEPRAYVQDLHRRAVAAPNVVLHGRVVREQLPALYRRASCLVCTSEHEGFPNTFLEAWSHGVPVVSTVDPDGLIAERKLGAIASDTHELAAALRRLLHDPQQWCDASRRARQYYVDNHAMEKVMPWFERIFEEVAQ
jgi:glycosyltransferase involved in cell wall biosynthesis